MCGSCYEQGYTGSMAEECSPCEFEGLEKQLQTLLHVYSSGELRADSQSFCSDFCKLVEDYASRWQVPLPQLRILEIAVIYFTRASIFFTSNCDHVLHTLSSLALSVFELLLFFDQKEFHQETLKHFTATFQECHIALERHQNVHLFQVARLVQGGGPWASLVLQAILSESILPQNEVDVCISSEQPVFFELRVRYLLSSARVSEAMALARCCARHPATGQHVFFLQVYLTWLHKTSQHDRLHKEVTDLSGKDAVDIICSLECEEEDSLLLVLCRAFLSHQLRMGDMYYLCDLVYIWGRLHSRMNTSKKALLEESHQLMLSATNVNSIFPFIRAILNELGEDGIQFCVELCASALGSCLPCDVFTKSLIYKTIAGLLPNDLEVCRACALLVFFLERTLEAYKIVYLLYMHPDQEYHVEYSSIGNHIRFETLQVLKKDLYFDPEFWNLIALRTNCLKLMHERLASAALEEIMEDKWISNYCAKEPVLRSSTLVCHKGSKQPLQPAAKKRHHKEDADSASKKLKVSPSKTLAHADPAEKKKCNKAPQTLKKTSTKPMRRSFWQLDRIQDSVAIAYGEHRRTTRLSEKNPPKRRIRQPRWLLEDSGTLQVNNVLPKIRKHGLQQQKHHRPSIIKRADGQIKNDLKYKPSVNSCIRENENNKQQKGCSSDGLKPPTPPQVILELSLPDNELMGTFTEDTCNRQRGFPQVLLYKPTVKLPATSQPVKTVHRKEVVLRARDEAMFVLQLHCYARQQKGKGKGLNIQGSVSTITRSSVQGSPPKEPSRELCEKPAPELKARNTPKTQVAADISETRDLRKSFQATTKAVLRKTSSARECSEKFATTASKTSQAPEVAEIPTLENDLQAQPRALAGECCDESDVEMKVTIASQTSTMAKVAQSPDLDKVSEVPAISPVSRITASSKVSQSTAKDDNQMDGCNVGNMSNVAPSETAPTQALDVAIRHGNKELISFCNGTAKTDVAEESSKNSKRHTSSKNDHERIVFSSTNVSETRASSTAIDQQSLSEISSLTLVTETLTDLSPEELVQDLKSEEQEPENSFSKKSTASSKAKIPHKLSSESSCSLPEDTTSPFSDMQEMKEKGNTCDIFSVPENSESVETPPESEESKLEYCCTFCHKDFKGSRVVAHAMFHYRKDECMFCGTVFKDDLLAMMHLSDHIEKLKKESVGKKGQENQVSETKDISTAKTSAKSKTSNMFPVHHSSGKLKKSVCPKTESLVGSNLIEIRKLRSNDKPVDVQFLQQKKDNSLKHGHGKTHSHIVNGRIGKKQEVVGVEKNMKPKQPHIQQKSAHSKISNGYHNFESSENRDNEVDSSRSPSTVEKDSSRESKNETEPLQPPKASKHNGKVVKRKNVETQEKVCCPVDGCAWFTDLSKNRVAILYHALEDHYGEIKPLELAFRVGNNRCSICMRVLWSFEHFLHHVERHRLSPRHPCLHQGCTARFKTGMEMRRHARKHSPLQAVCCVPDCPELFICLWALNLHEREHYASKSAKPDKDTNIQTGDKHNTSETGKNLKDHRTDDAATANAVNKTVGLKVAPNLRRQTTNNLSLKKNSTNSLSNPLPISKKLSKKVIPANSTVPHLRLRQTLRKLTDTTLTATKIPKVISSSLLKHNTKLRHKFKRNQGKVIANGCKRRGRPPKSNKDVGDEHDTAGKNNQTVKNALEKDQRSPPELARNLKSAEISHLSNRLNEEKRRHVVKAAETSTDESKLKTSADKRIENVLKQQGDSCSSTTVVTANSLNKPVIKKPHKEKKLSASQSASLDSSKVKKHRTTHNKTNTKVNKTGSHTEPASALKTTTESKFVVEEKAPGAMAKTSKEVEEAQPENTDLTQNNTEYCVPVLKVGSLDNIAALSTFISDNVQKMTEEKSKRFITTKNKGKKGKYCQAACSDKANKKYKDLNKEGDKRKVKKKRPCEDMDRKSVVKRMKAKSEVQGEAISVNTGDEIGKRKVEVSDLKLVGTSPSRAAVTSTKIISEKMSKKTSVKKKSDPNKANQGPKKKNRESKTKNVKKVVPDQLPTEGKTAVEESFASQEGKTVAETQSTIGSPGYSLVKNGQAVKEELQSPGSTDILAKYSKRPYMRLPPTAYLDEKYITMPKRRKEISFFQWSQKGSTPEQASATPAVQRHRCANCFATFSSTEELQSHHQVQNCSTLFGFDSDDEVEPLV